MLDIEQVRSQFPALASGYIYADNAGGAQVTKGVVDRITDYLLNTNVQLGADYSIGVQSTTRVLVDAPREAVKLFNAGSPDEITFGPSSTVNIENLARGLEPDIKPGDEIIVSCEHEANGGPWKNMAARTGAVLKPWKPSSRLTVESNSYSIAFDIADLLVLITPRTRLITFGACSNILGTVVPVKQIVKAARETARAKGAKKVEICVDCVAYAPHRRIDVQDWDVDFAMLSYYKLFGPHVSALYTRASVLENSVSSIVHHFLNVDKIGYKLQPAGPGYELVYGTTGVIPHLLSLTPENDLQASFDAIAEYERSIFAPLMEFLTAPAQRERGVRVVGEETVGPNRIPTVSFVVVGPRAIRSPDIAAFFDKRGGIGVCWGHFDSYSLVDCLEPKINMAEGVFRISLVHYNTLEEVQTIIQIIKDCLAQ